MKIIIGRRSPDAHFDMTPDGRILGPSWSARILRAAVIVAVIAAGLALAAIALWFALLLIPVAIVAALVAWGVFRWRLWQAGRFVRRP